MRPAAVGLLGLAALVSAATFYLSGALAVPTLPGFPAPDEVTPWLLSGARLVTRLAQTAAVGALVLALLLPATQDGAAKTGGQPQGGLSPYGWLAVRWAGRCAAAWAVSQAVVLPLLTADLLGTPLSQLSLRAVYSTATTVEAGQQVVAITALAVACAAISRAAFTRRGAAWALSAALAAVLPQAASGHSSTSGSHQIAVSSLVLHLGGILIWAGGLLALAVASRRVPTDLLATAARRFSTLALVAAVAVVASGLLNAGVRLGWSPLTWPDSAYGRIALLKLALSAVVIALGAAHRRRTLPALHDGKKPAFVRIALGEAAVFAALLGLAVALARTPPPARGEVTGVAETVLGFPVPGPVDATRLISDWYPEPVFAALAIAALAGYLIGYRAVRRRGVDWPLSRCLAWVAGWLMVTVAMSSGVARYAPVLTWAHMLQHLLLSMVAAPLLVLAAPVTLALRALPASADSGSARNRVLRLTSGRTARLAAHPFVVWPLFALTPFLVYFTGIYELALRHHFGHLLLSAHFLFAAYLFYNLIIGLDPLPHRPAFPLRLVMTLLTAIAHAIFGVVLMQTQAALAPGWFALINRGWGPSPAQDSRTAGGVAWVFGEIPFVLIVLLLVSQWFASDEREQRRHDRAVDNPDSRDALAVEEYNRYLAALAARSAEDNDARR